MDTAPAIAPAIPPAALRPTSAQEAVYAAMLHVVRAQNSIQFLSDASPILLPDLVSQSVPKAQAELAAADALLMAVYAANTGVA